MELEVTPEPSPADLEALREALRRRLAARAPESLWWREGIRENVLGDEEDSPDP